MMLPFRKNVVILCMRVPKGLNFLNLSENVYFSTPLHSTKTPLQYKIIQLKYSVVLLA